MFRGDDDPYALDHVFDQRLIVMGGVGRSRSPTVVYGFQNADTHLQAV
jgi:hypothetical protein